MNHLSHLWMTETRCAYCGAQSGTVIGADVCSRFTSPQAEKPEPLPHEVADNIMHGHFCQHCGEYFESIHRRNLCPARNEPPAETTGTPWVDEALPPRETAEALPELPKLSPVLYAGLWDFLRYLHAGDIGKTNECGVHLFRALLAECRKIAREEMSKARVEKCETSFKLQQSRWVEETWLRIVPGKEGE